MKLVEPKKKNNTVHNSKQAQALQSYFERTKTLRENNFNFGTTEILKSWAMRLLANRYNQLPTPEHHPKMFPLPPACLKS